MRPFDGVRVIEFGQFIAAPWCAQVLAEGGADVIKVESVEGDPVRQLAPLAPGETRHFVSRNRGKRTLPLDLRHPDAAGIVARLLERADVVLTNFRPGLAAEFGLDGPTLTRRHPRIVVGNVSAFGLRGPDAALAGMDLIVQARSGLMAAHHGGRDGLPGGGEVPTLAAYMCALMLAFGVASALLRRERTGRGGEVDVSTLAIQVWERTSESLWAEAATPAPTENAMQPKPKAAAEAARRPDALVVAGDTIYASVRTSGAAPSASLTARWTFEDGQIVEE